MTTPVQECILIQRMGLKMSRYIKKKVALVNSNTTSVNIETRYCGCCLVNRVATVGRAKVQLTTRRSKLRISGMFISH